VKLPESALASEESRCGKGETQLPFLTIAGVSRANRIIPGQKSGSEKRSDAECCRTPISQKFLDQDGHIP
jgi:hypothetical protein